MAGLNSYLAQALNLNRKREFEIQTQLNQPLYGFDTIGSTINTLNAGIGIVSQLAGLYTGFKSLSLAEDELEIKKKQFEEAQKELEHTRKVRSALTARF